MEMLTDRWVVFPGFGSTYYFCFHFKPACVSSFWFQTCLPCRAGVICLEAATTDEPQANNVTSNETNSFPCPPGYYCLAQSIAPTPCPAGTYNPNEFAESSVELYCIPCTVNYFNHLEVSNYIAKESIVD